MISTSKLSGIELFLFDLDGTLIDFHESFLFDEAERILQVLKHPPVEREAMENGFRAFEFFAFVDETHMPRSEFSKEFWNHFRADDIPKPVLLPGAWECLDLLKRQGKKIALVTSRCEAKERIERDLEGCGIAKYFDLIVPRASSSLYWSDKRPQIAEVVEQLGIGAERAAMIGDVPPDISSARLSGVAVLISLLSGGLHRTVLEAENPDLLIEGVYELLPLLKAAFGET